MLTDQLLGPIIEGVSNTYGEQFFNRITTLLGQASGADFCFIALADQTTMQATTIAAYAGGQLVDNFSYPLAHSPCEAVMCELDSVFPSKVAELFPEDILLAEMGIEGYIGASLKDADGLLLGIVVALFKQPVTDPGPIHTVFSLFSGRIAAEIARSDKAAELEQANEELEQRVALRTQELEATLTELQKSQQRLVEQQKFASLGNLVAGVAHEVNTPLGIGVTSTSLIRATLAELIASMASRTLTESSMQSALSELDQASSILEQNLDRAAKLVRSFKQVAVDNASLVRSQINLKILVKDLLSSLHPEIKKRDVEIQTEIPEALLFESCPGYLAQLLTNLLMNSLIHAYPDGRKGRILLSAHREGERIMLCFSDDGIGVSEQHRTQIFEPFFTTKRGQGGSGLGLNIVYNIVTQKLGGQIQQSTPDGGGCCYQIEFPAVLPQSESAAET